MRIENGISFLTETVKSNPTATLFTLGAIAVGAYLWKGCGPREQRVSLDGRTIVLVSEQRLAELRQQVGRGDGIPRALEEITPLFRVKYGVGDPRQHEALLILDNAMSKGQGFDLAPEVLKLFNHRFDVFSALTIPLFRILCRLVERNQAIQFAQEVMNATEAESREAFFRDNHYPKPAGAIRTHIRHFEHQTRLRVGDQVVHYYQEDLQAVERRLRQLLGQLIPVAN